MRARHREGRRPPASGARRLGAAVRRARREGEARQRRGGALDRFAEDFHGPDERYVEAALPELPYADDAFRLVLSGYLLFAYPDHLDDAAHEAGLRELLRVAREEVRLYPLIDTAYVRHPRIDALRRLVEAEGVATEVRRVDYGFQRGATEVLILRPPRRR